MKIIASSDWHVIPNLAPEQRLFHLHIPYLEEQMKDGVMVILLGDILEILRYGLNSVLQDEPTKGLITRFKQWQEKYNFKILKGNHDLDNPIADGETLVIGNTLFAHGHRWDMPNPFWRFLGKIAPPLFTHMTPFQLKRENRWEDYHLATISIEARFKNFLVKNGYTCGVFGHTHMAYTEDREIIKTANCGDWVDSFTCLESKNGVDWVKKELQDDY